MGGLVAAYQAEGELDVASTVIRPHLLMGEHFALTSDYLEDFYSFCFTREGVFWMWFRDEFTSCAAQLNRVLNKKKNKEGLAC